MKVVHTDAYGGYPNWPGGPLGDLYDRPRHDADLVRHVEALPAKTRERYDLAVTDVDGRKYWIQEYDGLEMVWTPETIPWTEVPE